MYCVVVDAANCVVDAANCVVDAANCAAAGLAYIAASFSLNSVSTYCVSY